MHNADCRGQHVVPQPDAGQPTAEVDGIERKEGQHANEWLSLFAAFIIVGKWLSNKVCGAISRTVFGVHYHGDVPRLILAAGVLRDAVVQPTGRLASPRPVVEPSSYSPPGRSRSPGRDGGAVQHDNRNLDLGVARVGLIDRGARSREGIGTPRVVFPPQNERPPRTSSAYLASTKHCKKTRELKVVGYRYQVPTANALLALFQVGQCPAEAHNPGMPRATRGPGTRWSNSLLVKGGATPASCRTIVIDTRRGGYSMDTG
jgi:hypothetical protein